MTTYVQTWICCNRLRTIYPVSVLLYTRRILYDLVKYFLFKAGKGGPAEGMGVSVSPRTKRLVTTGPYRYCRNPMVLGALLIYLSIVIFLNSLTALSALLIFFFFGITYLKLSEEKRLEKGFGDEFLEYRKKVPMLFPGIRFNKKAVKNTPLPV